MRAVSATTTAVCAAALAVAVSGCGHGAPRTHTPFFGVNVPGANAAEAARLGRLLDCTPSVVSSFVKLDSSFDPADLAELAAADVTPMITLEPWSWRMGHGDSHEPAYSLRSLTRGDHDEQLRTIARVLATRKATTLVRFAHEMNADWYPWGVGTNGNEPDHYVWAWRHVHDVISDIAPDLTWVWAPVASWWPEAAPLSTLYPGDSFVDMVGVTGYGHSGTAQDTFGDWYREVRELTDKPALLAEIGADGNDKRRWIASLGPFLDAHPDVAGFIWFNTSPGTTGATGEYRIDNDKRDTAAFRRLLDQLELTCTTANTTPKGNS